VEDRVPDRDGPQASIIHRRDRHAF
jgi:hypothetical protein